MDKLLRISWAFGWRLAVSVALFFACQFAVVNVQQFRGRSLRVPISWGISLHYCAYTFGLFAVGLATWAALNQLGRRWPAVAGTSLLYTVVASALCGAFSGAVDRPYLLLAILGSGVAGLVAPRVVQALAARLTQGNTQAAKAFLS
jgi:hypothetical protein